MRKIETSRAIEYKYNLLRNKLEKYTKENIMIAFSGGVDSSLLLKLVCDYAVKNGTKVYAVTAHTKLHPMGDLDVARTVADEAGAIHEILTIDELNEAGIENNPKDRCYRCKKSIFAKIKQLAMKNNIKYILEGTNEDDLHQYRPGIKALRELEIISPLAESGLTKADIRTLAANLSISVADRPSSPCLATRLPYGARIDYELLASIGECEDYIKQKGYYNVRVRVHGDIARIEVDKADISRLVSESADIVTYMKNLGFIYITVDMEGFRSGSMDVE